MRQGKFFENTTQNGQGKGIKSMQIRIYFDELTSPRDLILESQQRINGTHELNNENEYASIAFSPEQPGQLDTAIEIIKKFIKK